MLSSLGRERSPTLLEMEVKRPPALLYHHREGEEGEEVEEGREEVEGVEERDLLLVWVVVVDSFLHPD